MHGSSGKRDTKDIQSLSGSTNFTKSRIYDIMKEKERITCLERRNQKMQ